MNQKLPESIGPYQVIRRLGKGGMGEVLLAYDPRLDRQVAIKRIRPERVLDDARRQRFRREARVAASLNHPVLVQVFDMLAEGDTEHIVMEYVPGESLRTVLKRQPLTVQEGLAMARRLAEGLAYAHRRGVVHRDLKTENVLLTPEGEPKITDFGIARRLLADAPQETLTREGVVLGTYRSMAPEQIQGLQVDARSDLFAFGVLLYEALTGKSPFTAETETATLARVLNEDPPPLDERVDDLPRDFSALVRRLLQKDPQLRPQNTDEVVDELRRLTQYLGDSDTTAIMATVVEGRPPLPPGTVVREPTGTSSVTVASSTRSSTRRRSSERRQVTVMCCDLVGMSSRQGETLDPERLSAVMPDFQEVTRSAVESYEGHVERALGHRLVAYFGYPRAHEDDVYRAVRAALEVVGRIQELNRELELDDSEDLAVRLGVHTGPAVILGSTGADDPGDAQLVLGQTLDQAAGLQTLAGSNEVVVSPVTHRLSSSFFTFEALPPTRIPGSERSIAAQRVTGVREFHSRLEVMDNLTPLVARERELALLLDRWQLARQGMGQAVQISGEAGIGKSRLLKALRDRRLPQAPTWWTVQATPYTQNTPLHPLTDLLRQMAGIQSTHAAPERVDRLEALLRRQGIEVDPGLSLLGSFLSLPVDDRHSTQLSPERRRNRTLELLLELLLKTADRKPLVLVMEDLHWMDPSTLEWLNLLIEQLASVPLFLLLTFRLEFQPSWSQRSQLSQLSLTRLSPSEANDLARRSAGNKDLPESVVESIVAKADGVPLFVEELTRHVLESGQLQETEDRWVLEGTVGALEIPTSLRDSLTARLDRLDEEAREVAMMAAVLGRRFPARLLAAVAPFSEAGVRRAVDRLVEMELLQRRGVSWEDARFVFRHALIQDAAYEAFLESSRRELHQQVANVLENDFESLVESEPELLAHHRDRAGQAPEAIDAWQRAGDLAAERWAHVEAGNHYERALELIPRLPEGTERQQRELQLRAVRGAGLIVTRGYGAAEVAETYRRAWELCEELGEAPLPVRYGIWAVHLTRGDREATEEMAQFFEELLDRTQETIPRLMASNCLGTRYFYLGHYGQAQRHLQRAQELWHPEEHPDVVLHFGGCGGFYGHMVETWVHLLTGQVTTALKHQESVLTLAEELEEPYTLGTTLSFAMAVGHQWRDAERTRISSERTLRLATQHGFPWLQATAECGLGWAQAMDGDGVAGIRRMRKALDTWRAIGIRLLYPYYIAYLTEALLEAGLVADGLVAVEEGLEVARSSVDPFYLPELERLQAVLLARAGTDPAEVEQRLRGALERARRQGARSLELRLACSLVETVDGAAATGGTDPVVELRRTLEGFPEPDEWPDARTATRLLEEREG